MSLETDETNNIGLIISAVRKFGFSRLVVRGRSMLPVLSDGAEVKIVIKAFGEIRPHDWVAFTKNGKLLAHEVLFKSKKYLVSWGVNNNRTDGVVRENQVIGIVDKRQIWRRWHLIYLAEAKSLLHDFEMTEIKNLILKGPPWQIAKYGFLLDKPSADIDWLIDKNEYGRAKKILKKNGYRLKRSVGVSRRHYQGDVPSVSEMTYVKKVFGASLTIDLHLRAVREALTAWYKEPITRENMDRLTEALLSRRIRESGWYVLPDTEGLLYLCLNLVMHHAGRGIYQLANIAHLIDLGRIDWNRFEVLARNYRVESYIYFPLLWAARLFKVKIPKINQIKPSLLRLWLAKIVINRWAVMRPIPVSKWFLSRVNLLVIGYLRIVLSVWKKSHRPTDS